MQCTKVTKSVFKKLRQPKPKSHKYQNGLTLVVAGSNQYHGSLVFSAVTASRLVDLLLICTSHSNFSIVKKYSPAFIVHPYGDALKLAKKADSILIGPGIDESQRMKKLVTRIVSKNSDKPTILDATALHLISPYKLHSNCIVTPHPKEFSAFFKIPPTQENVLKVSKWFDIIVCLTGKTDFISNGKKLYCNSTGNQSMTKGGTGDTLAGLIAGFAAKSPLLESTLAACYLNGFTGDQLKKKQGTMFNAEDLMNALPTAFKKLSK
ncbi:MAG: NAD(P)H-hydrate dehydratase [archaeon]|nr:NAD(P)H-hydrate dehydratase [archaeon]